MTLGRINAYGTLGCSLYPGPSTELDLDTLSEAVSACGELTERKTVANDSMTGNPQEMYVPTSPTLSVDDMATL